MPAGKESCRHAVLIICVTYNEALHNGNSTVCILVSYNGDKVAIATCEILYVK